MALVKDPVCGMMIDPKTAAAHGNYGEKTVYFCSVACQKRFEQAGMSSR